MIEPQKAMLIYDPSTEALPGHIRIVDSDYRGAYGDWKCSLCACSSHWKHLSDEEIYQAMHWLALEIAEFAGVPIRKIRDQMQDHVRGYRQYADKIGKMALGGPHIINKDRSTK